MSTTERIVTTLARFDNREAKHAYDIEVGESRCDGYVVVEANNRDQASRIARRAGYTVRSVNMIG